RISLSPPSPSTPTRPPDSTRARREAGYLLWSSSSVGPAEEAARAQIADQLGGVSLGHRDRRDAVLLGNASTPRAGPDGVVRRPERFCRRNESCLRGRGRLQRRRRAGSGGRRGARECLGAAGQRRRHLPGGNELLAGERLL